MSSNYKIFKIIAISLGGCILIWLLYDFFINYEKVNKDYVEANNSFLKKNYTKAFYLYKKVSDIDPENLYALEGQARCLYRMKKYNDSEKIFKLILEKEENFLPALTNIAILYDTRGKYDKALIYYRKAIQQDSRVANRMSWFKRFIKNIHFKPSTIKERLLYLEKELNLDKNKRKLKDIKIDQLQPDYQL
jgi:tetratricopeptide (TPR) repeat protein